MRSAVNTTLGHWRGRPLRGGDQIGENIAQRRPSAKGFFSDAWRPDAAILRRMGYNPYRKHRATRGDYWLMASAAVAVLAMTVWALVG